VLAKQELYLLSHTANPFCFHYLSNRISHLFTGLPGYCFSYFCFSHSWNDRHTLPHPTIGWDGVLQTFCPGWPPTAIVLISASWVARMIGVSHHIWSPLDFWSYSTLCPLKCPFLLCLIRLHMFGKLFFLI
jgi:hypothetical protein